MTTEKTLRDEFAMAALSGMLAADVTVSEHQIHMGMNPLDAFTAECFQYADAMLAERDKVPVRESSAEAVEHNRTEERKRLVRLAMNMTIGSLKTCIAHLEAAVAMTERDRRGE